MREVMNKLRYCVGITKTTFQKFKSYITDTLRATSSFYDTNTCGRRNDLFQSYHDSIDKHESMSSIFEGIGYKMIDGVNIIEVNDGNIFLNVIKL